MTGHIDPTKEIFAQFRDNDRPGPIHMLNLVRLHDRARYPDGRDVSGADAYAAYGRDSGPVFNRLGGKVVWQGTFELMLIGPQSEHWHHCFIAEYPQVDAFVQMIRDPVYREAVKHRQAAVEDSRLIRMKPRAPGNSFGELVDWSLSKRTRPGQGASRPGHGGFEGLDRGNTRMIRQSVSGLSIRSCAHQ